jgi:hypothetical protein
LVIFCGFAKKRLNKFVYFNSTSFDAGVVKSAPSKGKRSNNLLLPSSNSAESSSNTTPGRVTFLEELNDRFTSVFPELWKLGQAYFAGELFVRADTLKKEEFKVIIQIPLFIYVYTCTFILFQLRIYRKWYWTW